VTSWSTNSTFFELVVFPVEKNPVVYGGNDLCRRRAGVEIYQLLVPGVYSNPLSLTTNWIS
jgi:hypothetical protein